MTPTDADLAAREAIVELGARLSATGLAPGRSGNLSVRLGERIVLTPGGSRLGALDSGELSIVGPDGAQLGGLTPTKEAALHLGMYRARPSAGAIVHLHSPHAVAVACLAGLDPEDALPPLTAYQLMQIGRLPLLPFFPPGSADLAAAVEARAATDRAMLLANHGLLAADVTLDAAAAVAEEIEATSRLFLLVRGADVSPIAPGLVERLSRGAD